MANARKLDSFTADLRPVTTLCTDCIQRDHPKVSGPFGIRPGAEAREILRVPDPEGDLKALVIDDFLVDPAATERAGRNAGFVTLQYRSPDGRYLYPGLVAPATWDQSLARFADQHFGKFPWQATAQFQACTEALAQWQRVHEDNDMITVIVFLDRDRDDEPGTSFYRHKKTGVGAHTAAQKAAAGARTGLSPADVHRALLGDKYEDGSWERVATVPTKFNRAVVFNGLIYHQGNNWGRTPEDVRLIYTAFLFTPSP